MHYITPHIAIIHPDSPDNLELILAPDLDTLVKVLMQSETEDPVLIITDGHWIPYETEVFRYCFIKGKITPEQLIRSIEIPSPKVSAYMQRLITQQIQKH